MTISNVQQTGISGHVIPNKKLAYWESIIEEWTLIIDRYCRIEEGDAPYWYTERADIGVLAGACWRAGYIALEEYQSEKGHPNKPKFKGRVDLWVENESKSAIIEAKKKSLSLNSKDVHKALNPILEEACKNAKESRSNQKELVAFGMVFIRFYIPLKFDEELNQKIEEMIKTITNGYKGEMIFWHFPSASRRLIGGSGKNYWPGVIVIARQI